MSIQTWVFGTHFLKESHREFSLPVLKFKLSIQNRGFGKLVWPPRLDMSDELGSDINKVIF